MKRVILKCKKALSPVLSVGDEFEATLLEKEDRESRDLYSIFVKGMEVDVPLEGSLFEFEVISGRE